MKKTLKILMLMLVSILIVGCGKDSQQEETKDNNETSTVTQETDDESTENNGESQDTETDQEGQIGENGESSSSGEGQVYGKATDYISFTPNIKYHFEGEGNEYATFDVFVDYIEGNKIQFRTNNGGTELVEVIEKNNDNLTRNYFRGEIYYRENLTSKVDIGKDIILKDPIQKGTSWTLAEGGNRTITGVEVPITTPLGEYTTIEVTTITGKGQGETREYFAKDIGLVKREFKQDDFQVVSQLSKVEKDVPLIQTIRFFYPDNQVENIVYNDRQVLFYTNDVTRVLLEKEYKSFVEDNASQVLTANAKILSLYLNKDGAVYIDFSQAFIDEMNAGTGYESLILQSIANTFGNYYGVEKVYLTVESKPYESGHILLNKGEKIEVNMENVID